MKQQLLIIWTMLAISQGIYLLVPLPPRENAAAIPAVFPIALGVVAIVQAIGIVGFLRIRAFNPIRAGLLNPASKAGAPQLFTTLLIAWVLAESVAVYGLLLRILHFPPTISAPFAAAAAILLFIGRPWNPRLERPASSADLARSSAPLN
jgi:F0F1-type ATP synthase membrane subunit c/vacuolar-type H+-ATPase subunit K